VRQDQAFKYWTINFSTTTNVVATIGTAINFKFYRMIYGRFLGFDKFNASFEEPNVFFKPFVFVSAFSIVTTMLPLLVGSVIGVIFINFGY